MNSSELREAVQEGDVAGEERARAWSGKQRPGVVFGDETGPCPVEESECGELVFGWEEPDNDGNLEFSERPKKSRWEDERSIL